MTDTELIEMHGMVSLALGQIEHCGEFATLIPEVRSNLVFARKNARTREDVLAVDGRITVVNHMPCAAGRLRLGASSHMARLIIEMQKYDPSIRAGIDFASTPELARWLEDYCRSKSWGFGVIDRRNEPEEIKAAEGASMPWKVKEAVRAAGGKPPVICYETGAMGKEPVSVLLGKDPLEIADRICTIAGLYHDRR
ncbi:thiamine-phosphate synthase family protein [Methanoregula sp.]|uniref:thiamine-phosphate synthase family protein n=1 Tax=Methanoregula sp. TaxID=2052170 RepID=UPI0035643B35